MQVQEQEAASTVTVQHGSASNNAFITQHHIDSESAACQPAMQCKSSNNATNRMPF